jgi:hypothetical protein
MGRGQSGGPERSPSRAAVDAGLLPAISPHRGAPPAARPRDDLALGTVPEGHVSAAEARPPTSKLWALPDPDDINACAYRIATPLQLSYCAPLSYDSDIARASLRMRERRAGLRRMVLAYETGLLADAFSEWWSAKQQRVLEDAKFARISELLGSALGHPLQGGFGSWAEHTAHMKYVREKLQKFALWFMMREIASAFGRWQALWAGCVDTRPVRRHGLRVCDYSRERMSKEQMKKFFCSDRGRNYLIALSNATGDQFFDVCRQQSLDLETLGDFLPEELEDPKGPGLPGHFAQGLYNKVKAMLHPTYFRIDAVLQYNEMTQMYKTQLEPLIEEFREMRRRGEHPLGQTADEMRVENHRKRAQQEVEDQNEKKQQSLVGVGVKEILVDARIKPTPESVDALRTLQVRGTDIPEDAGWARGYVFEFPDRMVGDLPLHEVWVDLVLPEDSSAFVFVADSKRVTGKPLHRSSVHKGRGMDEQQYRFQFSEESNCEVSNAHAVMVHITARHVPSKYAYWKEYRRVRKLNSILTIHPVESPKSLHIADSDKQLSMQFVFGRVVGQEELERDPSKRLAVAPPLTADTPLTPQTGETGGSRSRPETGQVRLDSAAIERLSSPDNLHEKRKALQSSKSVRFYNEESEQPNRQKTSGNHESESTLRKMRRSGKKTQLSRTRYFHGTRNMNKDMVMQRPANFACAFNVRFNEFWVMEEFPSPYISCLDFEGKALRKVRNFDDFIPNCMTIDSIGNLYMSDNHYSFIKFNHHRFYDKVHRCETDRVIRMWEWRDSAVGEPLMARKSRACGVAIDGRNEEILYAAFSKGPILLINTKDAKLMGRIEPDPPFRCVSTMCCCSDVLVVGDVHQVKIFDLHGDQISVIGQLYNDPCLLWTGLELYVGERRSEVWNCFQPKAATGIELSRQHERVLRNKAQWARDREAQATPTTPNTQGKIRQIRRHVEAHMDLDRPLSRAMGDSSRLALHQGLEYYDKHEKTYKIDKFFSIRDRKIRDELSELKEKYPELPVDAGNLYRAI